MNTFDELKVIDCSTNMKETEIYFKENIYVFLLVKGPVSNVTIAVVLTLILFIVKIRLVDGIYSMNNLSVTVRKAEKGRNVNIQKHDFLVFYLRKGSDSFLVKIGLVVAHLFH